MRKRNLSRIILVILALILTMGMFVMPAAAEKTGTTLKLHYYRPDGDYEGWRVRFWDSVSDELEEVPFVVEDGEMVASFPLKSGVDRVGYIIKQNAVWDVYEEQYIDVSGAVSEVMHVYVESGVKGYTPEPMVDFSVDQSTEKEPKKRNDFLYALGLILLLAVIVGANLLAIGFTEDVFDDGFNVVTGGIWFLLVLTFFSLLIPPLREFTSELWVETTTFKFMALPQPGTVMFWVDLVVSLVGIVLLWLLVEDADDNPLKKLFFMLLFGAVHAVAVVLVVGLAIRLLVIAIVCFIGYAVLSGAQTDSGSSTSTYTPPEPEPRTQEKVEVWKELDNGNKKRMHVNSDGSYYYDPDDEEWHKIKK